MVREQSYIMFAINYGFYEEDIPLTDIHRHQRSQEYLDKIPPLARRCELLNCQPSESREWSESAISALKSIFNVEEEQAFIRITQEKAHLLVVSLTTARGVDVARQMHFLG